MIHILLQDGYNIVLSSAVLRTAIAAVGSRRSGSCPEFWRTIHFHLEQSGPLFCVTSSCRTDTISFRQAPSSGPRLPPSILADLVIATNLREISLGSPVRVNLPTRAAPFGPGSLHSRAACSTRRSQWLRHIHTGPVLTGLSQLSKLSRFFADESVPPNFC